MKFNCLKCNIEMAVNRVQDSSVPAGEAGGTNLTFSCAHCGASFAMVANPMEQKLIKELGIYDGTPKAPDNPAEFISAATGVLQWEPDALKRLDKVPVFVRGMAKSAVEQHAREKGLTKVTVDVIEEARHLYGM
ncbi:MAG: hypothetical protein H7844_08645 [Nitrospirae bacterium YQR-1]